MWTSLILLLIGGSVLYLGAEWLVKGAAGIARVLGVRPLVIGMTVVAFGTSAPELVIATLSAWRGHGDIALGNVIGANAANLGFILGMTGLLAPPRIDARLLRREVPAVLLATLALPLFLADGILTRTEAGLYFAGAALFTIALLRSRLSRSMETAQSAESAAEAAGAPRGRGLARLSGITIAGMLLLALGGEAVLRGALALAAQLDVSERIIGLTVVSVGTTLPEFAASLVAALRRQGGIAVGNVLGSNLFNLTLILGVAGLVRPISGILGEYAVPLASLVGITLLAAVVLRTERQMTRVEGGVLVAAYAGFLVLIATSGHA